MISAGISVGIRIFIFCTINKIIFKYTKIGTQTQKFIDKQVPNFQYYSTGSLSKTKSFDAAATAAALLYKLGCAANTSSQSMIQYKCQIHT